MTKYKPLGVVGAICPWNFPLVLSLGKVIPALLTGCTIIIKPSPFTPYSALKAVELAQQIFPPGVVQALGGDDRLGPMFTAHPGIAKISFTGSTATGKKIMAACASTLKRVTLELGGNDASIVLPDVNIAKVAPELVLGAFQNSGQVCVATKRIYIHESIYQETLKAMSDFAKNLKIGNPDDAGVQLGPVQNEMQYERVKGFFAEAKKNNFNIVAGSADVPTSKGFFFEPTIIDNPPNGSRIIEEEPFGAFYSPQTRPASTNNFQALSSQPSHTPTLTRSSLAQTAPTRVSALVSGAPTSRRPKPWPSASRPAPSSSTRSRSLPLRPSSVGGRRAVLVASGEPPVFSLTAMLTLSTLISRSSYDRWEWSRCWRVDRLFISKMSRFQDLQIWGFTFRRALMP